MKKTKLLTSLVALALVVGLGACETGDIIVNVGDVDIGSDSSDTTDTEPSEPSEPSSSDTGSTPSEPEEDSSSSSSTPTEPPVVTHEYSIEVENADALKELTYDGNASTQQGVQLSIYLVDTPSEGTPTKEAATENDVTFTVLDPTVVIVSGLTVLPLKEGSTSITIAWADKATTSVDVLVTDITVNESEGPTSWADIITGNNGTEDYYDLLTALLGATIDDVLPFYYETEGNPSWYVTDTMFKLEYYPAPSGLSDVWFALLEADSWEQTDHTNNGWEDDTTYAKNGYTVKITLDGLNYWDLYLYPPEDTGEESGEDLETAQAILDAASAISSTGYNSFEYLYYDGVVSEYSGQQITENKYHLTLDENNTTNKIYGVREQIDDKTSHKYHYFYDGTDYYINASSVPSINGSVTATNFGSLIGPNVGTSSYNGAFDNVSSISLSAATDVAVEIEENGNYCLTLIYNDIWYCYKATADFELVGAGYAVDYNTANYSIYYGESISAAEFNEAMADFDITLWIPDYGQEEETSDDQIAQAILDAADDCDTYGLDWDAFHGEYIDESTDETDTLYLTTDSDGLYGSGICLDDGDPSFEYYYKNGKEYVHNSNYSSYSVNDSEFYYGDSYDDIFEDFTSDAVGDAFLLDLDDDDWTLTTLSDGYELIVETTGMVSYHTANVEYVYITDLDYNLLAVAYGYTASSVFVGWYAEQATTAQVEASLAGFDPANWGEVEEETEPSANEQVLAALEAFTDRGANYAWGEGFSYTSMSIDSYSYVLNEIAATSDDNGYLTSSTIDFSISSYDSYGYYSDGLTTYVYDGENVTDYGSLVYGYSTFYLTAYMTFAWQDYDYILEALEEFAYLDDLIVDDDFVVSDTAIYIYAYTSDYGSYFELDAKYDENGLTSLSFSSSINGEALAISLEPTSTISAPSWYI